MEIHDYSPTPEPENYTLADVHPLQTGDNEAWADFINTHGSSFLRTAFNSGATTIEDAEDACQESLLKLFEVRNTIEFDNPQAYVKRSVRNKCFDYRRRARSRRTYTESETFEAANLETEEYSESLFESIPDTAPNPEEIVLHRDEVSYVYSAMDNLPEEQRTAILLSHRDGYTRSECAAMIHAPRPTVTTRINRGIHKIQSMLNTNGRKPRFDPTPA